MVFSWLGLCEEFAGWGGGNPEALDSRAQLTRLPIEVPECLLDHVLPPVGPQHVPPGPLRPSFQRPIVPCLHSLDMIRAELASMLEKRPAITPRSLLRLWVAGSPFVKGGRLTARAEARIREGSWTRKEQVPLVRSGCRPVRSGQPRRPGNAEGPEKVPCRPTIWESSNHRFLDF